MGDTNIKEFSVKVAYKMLGPQNTIIKNLPWKLICKIKLPSRLDASIGLPHEARLTQDNLTPKKSHIAKVLHVLEGF